MPKLFLFLGLIIGVSAFAETSVEGVYAIDRGDEGEVYNVMAIKRVKDQLTFYPLCETVLGLRGFYVTCLNEGRLLNGNGPDFTLNEAYPVHTMSLALRCPLTVSGVHVENGVLIPKGNADFAPLIKIKKYTPDLIETPE